MKQWDKILIEWTDEAGEPRKTEGIIRLISPNQVSLMIEFEAIILGHVGMMPLVLEGDRRYYPLLMGTHPIGITVIER